MRWRFTCIFLELPVEIRHILKSALVAVLSNIVPVFQKELTCIADPYFIKKSRKPFSCAGFKKPAKRGNRHVGYFGSVNQ
jgi:hypothetical protein